MRPGRRQRRRDLHAGAPRHLNVEEDHVRRETRDLVHRAFTVLGLADDVHIGHFCQQPPEPLPRRLLVVHQERPDLRAGHRHFHPSAHRTRAGGPDWRTLPTTRVRSSRAAAPRAELPDAGERRLDDLPRRQRRVPAEDRDQAVHAKLASVRRGRFGQSIGVHRQHVTGGERDGSLLEDRLGRPADDRTRRVEHPDAALRREHDGGRVSGVDVGQRGGCRIEGAEEHGGEPVRLDRACAVSRFSSVITAAGTRRLRDHDWRRSLRRAWPKPQAKAGRRAQ